MAQVPYSPVPDVGMQDIATGKVGVSGGAIEGASGENIGKALSRFGAVLEHSGDELFKTAMKLQDDKNQAEALEAEVGLSGKVSDIHLKFAASEGRIPSDKLMEYRTEIDNLRKKIREGLSSDAVRRMYDRNALRTQEIAVRQGASHAASQLKRYKHEQEESTIKLEKQRVYDNPNDPIDVPLNRVEELVRRAGADGKQSPEAIEEEVRKHRGEVTANRIHAIGNEQPALAQGMLNDAIAKKELWGDQATKLQEHIKNKLGEVETRKISETISSNPVVTLEEGIKMAKEMADEIRPGDPVFRDRAVETTVAKINRNKAVKREDQKNAEDTVNEAIMDDKVKTMDDLLLTNPGIDRVIDRTSTPYKKDIQRKINSYQSAINKPINDAEEEKLIAMRRDSPLEFSEIDPTKLPLNKSQMAKVIGWQKADNKKPLEQNPQVTRAMQWIKNAMIHELAALGIAEKTKDNTDDYNRWRGQVYTMLDFHKQKTGNYPTEKEVVNDLAPLILKRTVANYYWWNAEKPLPEPQTLGGLPLTYRGERDPAFFKQPTPKKFEDEIRARIRMEEGKEMESFEVDRAWLRTWLTDPEKAKSKYPREK